MATWRGFGAAGSQPESCIRWQRPARHYLRDPKTVYHYCATFCLRSLADLQRLGLFFSKPPTKQTKRNRTRLIVHFYQVIYLIAMNICRVDGSKQSSVP